MKKMKVLFKIFGFVFGIIVIGNYVIAFGQNKDRNIDSSTKKNVIAKLFEDLHRSYVFPEVAKKIETDINNRLKNKEYDSITSGRKFAEKLTQDLQSASKDKHLGVRFSYDKLPVRQEADKPTKEEIQNRLNFMRRVNYGFDRVERLEGNIGYIELRGFFDPKLGEETVAAAMNFVVNTKALVIDLRRNGGGDPEMVALICSYFFGDEKVHLNDLYWREGDKTREFWTNPKVLGKKYLGKDVYILTSGRTFSGAEEFSYNLKNLKRATIIGETTGGGAHPGDDFRLNDHFSAFISTGRAINPITKTNWEGTGVKPDVAVSKEKAFDTAYVMALKKVLDGEKDENIRAAIERKIISLSKKPAE